MFRTNNQGAPPLWTAEIRCSYGGDVDRTFAQGARSARHRDQALPPPGEVSTSHARRVGVDPSTDVVFEFAEDNPTGWSVKRSTPRTVNSGGVVPVQQRRHPHPRSLLWGELMCAEVIITHKVTDGV